MRTTILLAGLAFTIAACSDVSPDRSASEDERVTPDLALTRSGGGDAVVSDIEIHKPAAEDAVSEASEPVPARTSTLEVEAPAGPEVPEVVASVSATEPAEEENADVHDDHAAHADGGPAVAASGPAEGGGKPTGITDGLDPVPDRDWGGPVIFDDPGIATGPLAGVPVIIRGGPGGIDDDCAIHPRGMPGGMVTPGMYPGAGDALVNDRTGGRTRGVSINERAPRSRPGGSIPRGAGFPRRGIR